MIAFIEVQAFSHATEDLEKVMRAIGRIIPEDAMDSINFVKTESKGHYGNPITVVKARVNKKQAIRGIMERLASGLDETDRVALVAEFNERFDDRGNIYVRLDKQSAYMGRLRLGREDPIRLQIKFAAPSSQRDKILGAWRRMLLPEGEGRAIEEIR